MQQRKREEVLDPYRTWYHICVSTGFASASFLWIQRVFRFAYLRKPVYPAFILCNLYRSSIPNQQH